MKRLLAVAVALGLWCGSARATNSPLDWDNNQYNNQIAGPGGGGNFKSVDVNSVGRVIVSGDVSGLYWRDGINNTYWIHVGSEDGLTSNRVFQAKFCPGSGHENVVLAGSANGMFFSADSGKSFARENTSLFQDLEDITAIGWSYDSVAVFWRSGSSFKCVLGTTNGSSMSWNTANTVSAIYVDSAAFNRVPIKIVVDPNTRGTNSPDFYVVFGSTAGVDGGNVLDLWRSTDGGASWERVAPRTYAPKNPVDIAFRFGAERATVATVVDSSSSSGTLWLPRR